MELGDTFQQFGIALGLGLLVGLQRQRAAAPLAGFRTFPLVTVLGTLCALLADRFGGWVLAVGLAAVAGLIVVGNLAKWRKGDLDPGLTTEVALLVMFGVGAYLVGGSTAVALAVGGGVAVLLHLKPQLHSFASKIGDVDFKAIMQFTLITLVILPVLPDEAFGPYQVLNPHRIWLMVVLIVAISLGGYVAYKIFGAKTGSLMGGLLGGLISSTATTVSYARRSRAAPEINGLGVFVVTVASTVVFVRVLVLMFAAAPRAFAEMAPPLAVMLLGMAAISLVLWLLTRHDQVEMPPHTNPTELKSALFFGALFGVVLLATAAGKQHFGERGLYAVAVMSGLTDMDAITLSTSQMVNDSRLVAGTGWRLVLVASLSNLVFKATMAAVLGGRDFARRVALVLAAGLVTGVGILLFWPA